MIIRITVILTILHDVAVESVKKRKRTLTKYLAVYSQVRMIVGIVVCVGCCWWAHIEHMRTASDITAILRLTFFFS